MFFIKTDFVKHGMAVASFMLRTRKLFHYVTDSSNKLKHSLSFSYLQIRSC